MATNWNLLQMPDIGQAFQQGQEMRRQSDGRNALAAYAANPNEQSLNALSPYNPQFVVQTKRQDQQFQLEQQKLQQKTHGEQMQVLGKLIAPVKDEASYQQALAAARQGGLDVSTAPPSFDPAYIGRTKMLVDAYNKDGGKAISAAGQQALDLGYQRDTPEFAQVVAQILEAGQAKPYVVGGETRLYRPNFTPAPQQPPSAPAVGVIEDGHRFKGGNPADPSSWEPVEQSQPQMTVSPRELDALVRKFGPNEVQRRLDSGAVVVGN